MGNELNVVTAGFLKGDEEARYVSAVNDVTFRRLSFTASADDTTLNRDAWDRGRAGMIAVIRAIQHRFAMRGRAAPFAMAMNRVFIVHGHDHPMLHDIEAFVRRIGIDPVVLMEEASRGKTVIEKVEAFADVPFAIVLFSPDDIGRSSSATAADEKLRPRQNAVLEAGFFLGRLGRHNVAVLVDADRDVQAEYPSDLAGVVTIHYRSGRDWKTLLMREFKGSDLVFDGSKA